MKQVALLVERVKVKDAERHEQVALLQEGMEEEEAQGQKLVLAVMRCICGQ